MLRLAGINTTPEHHAAFFRRHIRAAAPRAILISGTADYSLLAQILPVAGGARISVLDRCDTPLALNRWYARRAGVRIATRHADILDYRPGQRFDLICTHSFLGQFAPQRRSRLLAAWHAMLRPGGVVLTVNRLRRVSAGARVGFSKLQASTLQALIEEKAGLLGSILRVERSRLAGMAENYARHMGAWPIRSVEEISTAFQRAGFRVEHSQTRSMLLRAGRRLRAPTSPGGAPYARIAARRI